MDLERIRWWTWAVFLTICCAAIVALALFGEW
jgi:hypothetical protein